jgi:hypothetical protein
MAADHANMNQWKRYAPGVVKDLGCADQQHAVGESQDPAEREAHIGFCDQDGVYDCHRKRYGCIAYIGS